MKTHSTNPNLSEPRWLRVLLTATALGFLLLMLVVPLVAVFYEALKGGWDLYLQSLTDPEAWSAIKLTLITALIVVPVNAVLGVAMAWLLTRFDFRGKQLLTTLLDLPFSVSPVVAGLMFVLLFGAHTALGGWLEAQGIQIIFAIPGIILATLFVTFPFVAREIIPLMQAQGDSEEQAALILGASGWQMFWRVTLPNIKWALLYGIILTNARAMGEFGAVSVVSGHIRGETNTIPLLVEIFYNEYNFTGAFALSGVLALLALATLAVQNIITKLQDKKTRRRRKERSMSITIRNLNKHFGAFHALKNINLNVPTGKLVSLLGPSGCGKTTLLRIIAGLENADGGNILFDGQDVTAKHVRERKVGFVFQHYALFRHMNVFDNVAFGLTVLPKSERPSKEQIRAKVEELLKLVQLSHLAKSYPHQLSGGQRQRIALARALAVEPKLLLLDEPFGALDAKVRKELRTWLRDIHHNLGVTSILVTHDQEEALEVSDEIVVMNHGKIEQTGSAEAIYRKPENAFVTEFLGETDAFEGRIEKGIWHYNGFAWKLDAHYKWQEQTAIGYIRPHEWQLAAENETPMIRAKIEKIHAVGALTHILVKHDKQDVHITLAGSDAARYQIAEGKELKLIPKQVYVFSQNELIEYSI